MARQKYPNEHVGWFKVSSNILDDEALVTLGNDGLATWIRLLAMLNRTRSTDGIIRLSVDGMNKASGKRRRDVSLKSLRSLAEVGLTSLALDGDFIEITVHKWLKYNGIGTNNYGHQDQDQDQDLDLDKNKEKSPPAHVSVPTAAVPRKSKKTVCPDRLEAADRERLLAWAAKNNWSESQISFAFNRVKDWSQSKALARADWVATIRNAIREGWALEKTSGKPGESPAEGRQRRTRENAQRAFEIGRQRDAEGENENARLRASKTGDVLELGGGNSGSRSVG